jgi:type II secretory pathway component GspD/PulD (secretin)
MKTFILALSLISFHATYAATWKEKCLNLRGCMDAVSELTGARYLAGKDIGDAAMDFSSNFSFSKEDADLIFTSILDQNGLARLRLKDGTYLILRQNDAKGKDVPLIQSDYHTAPALPDTYDLVTLQYKFRNAGISKDAENVIRTYANMGARIYGADSADLLFITDSARGVRKAYEILRSLDVKPTAEYQAKRKAWENARLKAAENGESSRHSSTEHSGQAEKSPGKK